MTRTIVTITATATAITVASFLSAQNQPAADQPTDIGYGVMRLQAKLGSFALEGGQGKLEMDFRGTLLLHDYQGDAPVITGQVRKEFEGMGRSVWFGKGKAVLNGSWRRIQWFGGDLNAIWNGRGIARLFGEYTDETGDTGTVWVDDEPPSPWYTHGMTFYVPKEYNPAWPEIKKRRESGTPSQEDLRLKGGGGTGMSPDVH